MNKNSNSEKAGMFLLGSVWYYLRSRAPSLPRKFLHIPGESVGIPDSLPDHVLNIRDSIPDALSLGIPLHHVLDTRDSATSA